MNVLDNYTDSVLAETGLSHSERQVYLSAQQNLAVSSAEIVKRTRMPRATVLAALKSLRVYGLCKTQRRDGRSYVYIMQSVQKLKSYVGQQVRELDSLMDSLDEMPTVQGELTTSEVAGQKGLQELLELALRCKSRQWQIIAPHSNALRYMPKTYTDYFKKVRREREIQSQTLWESAHKDQQVNLRDVLMRKPRYVPGDVSEHIPSMLLAFDDKLLVIDGTSHPTAVLIESGSVVSTYRIIFEMAWRSVRG